MYVCKKNGNNNPSVKVSCNKLQYKKQQTKDTYIPYMLIKQI